MRSYVAISFIALMLLVQSCCCCTILGGPEPPYSITPSDDAIEGFKERWHTAVDGSPDGSFSITLTEEEMTSLIVNRLDQEKDVPPVRDLQVHLRNGRIEVYATIMMNGSLPVPGMIAFSAKPVAGTIGVTLEDVAFGPLPVPDSALEAPTDVLNELISRSVITEMGAVTITDIQIGEGDMTLFGQIAPDSP